MPLIPGALDMKGVVRISHRALEGEDRRRFRRTQCGVCRILRDRMGGLGPLAHRHDLTLFGLLAPADAIGRSRCSALPFLTVGTATWSPDFGRRLAGLAALMASLEAADARTDDDSISLPDRVRSLVLGPETSSQLAALGLAPDDVHACAAAVGRLELHRGLPVEAYLRPVVDLAGLAFAPLFRGILPESTAVDLGNQYVSTIWLLDAFEDLSEDDARGHFNLVRHASFPGDGDPRTGLRRAAETFGSLLLSVAPPASRAVIRSALDSSLGPAVARVLHHQEVA